MNIKEILIALIVILFVIVGAVYMRSIGTNKMEDTPLEAIDSLGFGMSNLKNFTVTEQFGKYFSDDREQNLSVEKEGDIMRIKIISNEPKDKAEKYSAGQSLLLESQYDSRLPPYPEFLTNQTGCADNFLPQHRTKTEGTYYLIHADERFNYGLCSEDLIRYKAGFGIFYCEPEQKLFQVEYFIGKDRKFSDVESFMDSFNCTNTSRQ